MTDHTPPTEQKLDDIETRAAAATDGPWDRYPEMGPTFFANITGEYLRGVGDFNFGVGEQADADEAFVRHAQQDVTMLAAEVRRLRAALPQPVVVPSKDTPLSEYDFVELVAFAHKVESEGFGYAFEEYPPRFEAPELAPVAADYSLLRQLFDEWQEALGEFWTRPDAGAVYDAHNDEARRRRREERAAAVAAAVETGE